MPYLTQAEDIQTHIAKFASAKVLWLDTEVADWQTSKPRLSLIQVLVNPNKLVCESTYILDVLDKPELTAEFIAQIMVNPNIEKVFHNASYDLKYLGDEQAQNITCTLKLANKVGGKKILGTSNLKLKTLAIELCKFSNVDTEEQASDWGRRSLTPKQLHYAAMDTVYLAAVHRCLLEKIDLEAVKRVFAMTSDSTRKSSSELDVTSLTPTKVRIAFECPRLFYLHQKFGGNTLFISRDTNINFGVGNAFHRLADAFVQLALQEPQFQIFIQPDASQLQVERVTAQMQSLFYQLKFFPYLQEVSQKDARQAPGLLKVWTGLQGLIKKFAELLIKNRKFCGAETVIAETFIIGDRKLEHVFTLPDGNQQRVAGEFDCLVYNFELRQLCVIEFKTYRPVDPSAQLAQVALYSYMLWAGKKVAVDSAVYCVLPEFQEYSYSWKQLENTVHQLIPHKLQQMQQWLMWEQSQPEAPPSTLEAQRCHICPQQEKCQTYFAVGDRSIPSDNGSKGSKPPIIKKIKPPEPNADEVGAALVDTLQSFKLGADYQGAVTAPAFIRVKLKPHPGVKVASLLSRAADLQVQLGLANAPLITPQPGYVSVDLPRSDRQVAHFDHYIQPAQFSPTEPVKVAIGIDLNGQLIEADLSDPNTCHFLVGGTTGSGKSEFLRSLLLSLLLRYSPQNLKVALVDPKRVTFPEFESMPWLHSPIVKDTELAIELMTELVDEMEARYRRLEKARCGDIKAYNQQAAQPLPRIVCIFDEYADFMAEKEASKELEQSIKRLGAKARAAGIHLIIATQRPEAKVVTPLIRSNLPGRVALRTASEADSTIILGGKQAEAAYLLGKGDLLYQAGAGLWRLQSLFAEKVVLPGNV
jgi:S-DNA-T family DNA segregation ATPase FtsK/SpoIIIE